MIQQTPFVRRQVRKLLLFICGSKEKYRQLRDLHTLDSHVRSIKKLLEEQGIFLRAGVVTATSGSALQYDTLISLVSHDSNRAPVVCLCVGIGSIHMIPMLLRSAASADVRTGLVLTRAWLCLDSLGADGASESLC